MGSCEFMFDGTFCLGTDFMDIFKKLFKILIYSVRDTPYAEFSLECESHSLWETKLFRPGCFWSYSYSSVMGGWSAEWVSISTRVVNLQNFC